MTTSLEPLLDEGGGVVKSIMVDYDMTVQSFVCSLGMRIAVYHYPRTAGTALKGVIQCIHGMDAFTELDLGRRPLFDGEPLDLNYSGSWVEALNNAGYECYGVDMPGYGRSESFTHDDMRSMIFRYEDLVDVQAQLRYILGLLHPAAPVALFGQSMGGCVGVRTLERLTGRDAAEGYSAAFIGCPAVELEKVKSKPINRLLLPVLSRASTWLPWLYVGSKEPDPCPPAVALNERLGLPLANPGNLIRARYCEEALKAAERAQAEAKYLTLPLLLMHSPQDPFVDFAGSEKLLALVGSTDKELFALPESTHNLQNTLGRDKYIAYIVQWLDTRMAPPLAPSDTRPQRRSPRASSARARSPARRFF